jgi:hypothetical protein
MSAATPAVTSIVPELTEVRSGDVKVSVRGPTVPRIASPAKVARPFEEVLTIVVPDRLPPPVAMVTVIGTPA